MIKTPFLGGTGCGRKEVFEGNEKLMSRRDNSAWSLGDTSDWESLIVNRKIYTSPDPVVETGISAGIGKGN